MTGTDAAGVRRIAARAALAVPGVVELQPSLRQSLAGAATHVLRALGSPEPHRETGIHAERGPGGAWHIDARCVVHDRRRVVDTAREVHDSIRGAVGACAGRDGTPGAVTVAVTVSRIVSPSVSPRRGDDTA